MPHLYLLFEHAAGYALFKSIKVESNDLSDVPTYKASDIEVLKQLINLHAFMPFERSEHALENMGELAEGRLHADLVDFLNENIQKKKKVILGISDAKLAMSISELDFSCSTDEIVQELLRGIRCHFHTLIDDFGGKKSENSAQLGLGHCYSRKRVKYSVKRNDNMIIQSINLLDQLDKDINNFIMRVREWYSLHFPELLKVVPENALFIRCVHLIKNRKEIEGVEEQLEEIVNDPSKVAEIMRLAKFSMGMDIAGPDLENVYGFVDRIVSMTEKRKNVQEYLRDKMANVAPNLGSLVGDVVAARLISHSGSLCNLAKLPASTVQILGAEKALFRALKTRGATPKYGLLYHSKYVAKAQKQDKGRISRYLANKCSTACRIDFFRENPTSIFGDELKDQVENRLKFLENGEVPEKNVDIMTRATEKAEEADKEIKKSAKKEKKKRKSEGLTNGDSSIIPENNDEESELPKKKKKKRKHDEAFEEEEVAEEPVAEFFSPQGKTKAELKAERKAAKKRKLMEAAEEPEEMNISAMTDDTPLKKKKKKKKKSMEAAED